VHQVLHILKRFLSILRTGDANLGDGTPAEAVFLGIALAVGHSPGAPLGWADLVAGEPQVRHLRTSWQNCPNQHKSRRTKVVDFNRLQKQDYQMKRLRIIEAQPF